MAYEGKRRTSDELAAYRQNIKGSRETVASFREHRCGRCANNPWMKSAVKCPNDRGKGDDSR